jgi:hypothetical protein
VATSWYWEWLLEQSSKKKAFPKTNQKAKGGVLHRALGMSLARLNHSCVQDALLERKTFLYTGHFKASPLMFLPASP